MIDKDNPHRREFDAYGLVYWKDGRACGEKDEPDRIVVYTRGRMGQYPDFAFDMPAERYKMERMCTALQHAFDNGRKTQRTEFRNVMRELLGIEPAGHW